MKVSLIHLSLLATALAHPIQDPSSSDELLSRRSTDTEDLSKRWPEGAELLDLPPTKRDLPDAELLEARTDDDGDGDDIPNMLLAARNYAGDQPKTADHYGKPNYGYPFYGYPYYGFPYTSPPPPKKKEDNTPKVTYPFPYPYPYPGYKPPSTDKDKDKNKKKYPGYGYPGYGYPYPGYHPPYYPGYPNPAVDGHKQE